MYWLGITTEVSVIPIFYLKNSNFCRFLSQGLYPYYWCSWLSSAYYIGINNTGASQVLLVVKNPLVNAGRCKRCRFDCWVRKIPWRRSQQPTPVFLPEKFHGQRSLAGYNPWGRKESDATEHIRNRNVYPIRHCVLEQFDLSDFTDSQLERNFASGLILPPVSFISDLGGIQKRLQILSCY